MNSLETKVLHQIGESVDSPDVFTDDSVGMAQIRESINDAIEEICMITGSYRRKYFLPLESNMTFYRLDLIEEVYLYPTSVWLIDQKRRLEGTDLAWLNYHNPRWLHSSGNPLYYFSLDKDVIGFHPTPSSDTDQVQINCVVAPDRYTLDTDRIKLRTAFQYAVVHYAVSEYWASRGDAKNAVREFIKYIEKLELQTLYPEHFERQWEKKTK